MQGLTSTPMRLNGTADLSSSGRSCVKWALVAGLMISVAPTGLEYATLTHTDAAALQAEEAVTDARASADAGASARATPKRPSFGFVLNGDPAALDEEQHNVAHFLASRYRRSLDQVRHFVSHAYQSASSVKLDPWVVLAVMAVESGFDPHAQSSAGAQGLMQILTRVNLDRLAPFGGAPAVFDPIANIRVGTDILHMLLTRNGSIEGALKSYVGAANLPSDGGYTQRVLAMRDMIAAAAGVKAPARAPTPAAALQVASQDGEPAVEASGRARHAAPSEQSPGAAADGDATAERAALTERSAANP